MKKLVAFINKIMIGQFTTIPALLGMMSLIISACSAGGGSGSDSGGNSNIQLRNGQYSGYYRINPGPNQSMSCSNGLYLNGNLTELSETNLESWTAAVSHQGSSVAIHNLDTGEVTMTGTVNGSAFHLQPTEAEVASSGTNGSMTGEFTSTGWAGDFLVQGPSDDLGICTFKFSFSGNKTGNFSTGRSNSEARQKSSEEPEQNSESVIKDHIEKLFGNMDQ
jgi:hypothetical protein